MYLDTIEGGVKERVVLLESVARLVLRNYFPSDDAEGQPDIYCSTLVVRQAFVPT